jgi:hypothetical protein
MFCECSYYANSRSATLPRSQRDLKKIKEADLARARGCIDSGEVSRFEDGVRVFTSTAKVKILHHILRLK